MVCVVCSHTWRAFAVQVQVLYGSLTGNVTDPTGSAIPGAKVEAVNLATGVVKPATTGERGAYVMSDLQTGTYKVTISATSRQRGARQCPDRR
jgi:hypothetical protein